LAELAERFGVSHGYTKKIRKQQLRTGQMEQPAYRAGRRSRVTPEIEAQLRSWVQKQPDLTLQELQQRLYHSRCLHLSMGRLWLALRELKLRLKKNTSRSGARHAGKPAAP
jgi:transposase